MALLVAAMLFVSCAGLSKGPTEFERFSTSFAQEVAQAEQTIEQYAVSARELSGYEQRVGNLSDSDYAGIEKITSKSSDAKRKKDLQLQKANDTGRSVTADGYYAKTKEPVGGWDNAAYAALHIETTLRALDQANREAEQLYGAIDFTLLKKPNKPFNASATRLIAQAHSEIVSAQSDVAAKDWAAGKDSVDRANSVIKNALTLELNDIEQHQITLLQNKLRKVSSDVSLGSTLHKAGSIIEDAAKGATGILGGIGEILKGVGEQLQ
jgi:hypothetical protein